MTTDLPGDPSAHPALDAAPPAMAPAGWHPDPMVAGQQRYWDGTTWTTHTAPGQPSAPSHAAAPVPAAPHTGQHPPTGAALAQLPWWLWVAGLGVVGVVAALLIGAAISSRTPVDSAISACTGQFAQVDLSNNSGSSQSVTVKVAWYENGTQVDDATDYVDIPAGDKAVSQLEPTYELDFDAQCKIIEVRSRAND